MRRALICLLVACGGKPAPRPQPPPPLDAKLLARKLDDDMSRLAELAARHRGDCSALARALEPHVATMKSHASQVAKMLEDPAKAKQLETELAAYAKATPARTDKIAEDLGATYRSCKDEPTERHRLESAIAEIPTY